MNIENIEFLINFATEDIAEVMMEEDSDNDISDEEYVQSLLEEENLSIEKLDKLTAFIVNDKKSLKIKFIGIDKYYTLLLLDFIDKNIFFVIVNFFKNPKEVKIINPSAQVGGIIDKNYGVKFKIKLI